MNKQQEISGIFKCR